MVTPIDDESQNLFSFHTCFSSLPLFFQHLLTLFFESYTVKKILNIFSAKFIDFSSSSSFIHCDYRNTHFNNRKIKKVVVVVVFYF